MSIEGRLEITKPSSIENEREVTNPNREKTRKYESKKGTQVAKNARVAENTQVAKERADSNGRLLRQADRESAGLTASEARHAFNSIVQEKPEDPDTWPLAFRGTLGSPQWGWGVDKRNP